MLNLSKLEDVKGIQSNLRGCFATDSGKEVLRLLEVLCGWYDFNETDPDRILIAHGKRQVLATIKTLLELTPDQVVALAKTKEN